MIPNFSFEYQPGKIVYGRGCINTIEAELERRNLSRAMIVCGANVGANRNVMDPLIEGIGDRLVGVFDETTPAKFIGTAFDGVDRMNETGADAIVSVGGGSSLDTAKAISMFRSRGCTREDVVGEIAESGTVRSPDEATPIPPIFAVPTTLAGADISSGCKTKLTPTPQGAPTAETRERFGRISDPRLMPSALFYDPTLFATTPKGVLAASAMNGFNKAIDTLYSRQANPMSNAFALHGLRYLRSGLPNLRLASPSDEALDQSVIGAILVQNGRQTNIIHAFGHGLSYFYDVQQGAAHGILAPPVLEHVFEQVDGNRHLLAEGLGVDTAGLTDGELAGAIVDGVSAIRDALELPVRLGSVSGVERAQLPAIASAILADSNLERNPPGLTLTQAEIEAILDSAW